MSLGFFLGDGSEFIMKKMQESCWNVNNFVLHTDCFATVLIACSLVKEENEKNKNEPLDFAALQILTQMGDQET